MQYLGNTINMHPQQKHSTPSGAEVPLSVIHKELLTIKHDVASLKDEMTRYKSFVGGVVWAVGAISAAVGVFMGWIQKGV